MIIGIYSTSCFSRKTGINHNYEMKKVCFIVFSLMVTVLVVKGQKLTQAEYIAKYKNLAVSEMYRSGIPASITLAQGLLETESGNSPLVLRSNNHFGIKCKSNWNGPSVSHDDDERDECFRAYGSAEESYRDHSDFLRTNSRYAFLFDYEQTNYKDWAHGLKQAGYATNPRYPEMLIRFIETNDLQQFDSAEYFVAFSAGEEPTHLLEVSHHPVKQKEVVIHTKTTPSYLSFSNHVVNGSKAVFVHEGTSLLAIATKQKIHLTKLLELNDLKKDGLLEKAQFIFLEKKAAQGQDDFYIAEVGETLYDIAQKNGVLLQNLLSYNNLGETNSIEAGKKIYLKKTSTASLPISFPDKDNFKTDHFLSEILKHKVVPKEGLYSISKKYGVSVNEIKNWNKLSGDHLQIGQELIISK